MPRKMTNIPALAELTVPVEGTNLHVEWLKHNKISNALSFLLVLGGEGSQQTDVDMKAFTKDLGGKPLKAPDELQNYFLRGAVF